MSNKSNKIAGEHGLLAVGALVTLPPRRGALWLQHGMFSRPFTAEAV
jgi:hypothetical protein